MAHRNASAAERSSLNVAILKHLVEVVEAASPALRHVAFYQGGKAYGSDLGPFKTPAREDDPRLMSPNFYYDQEDFLRSQQVVKWWHWTALRPEAIIGYATGNPRNLGVAIATKYGLLDTPYEKLASWNFADFIFNSGFDNVSSTIKARKAGFAECIDSEEMFRAFFGSLRDSKVIP